LPTIEETAAKIREVAEASQTKKKESPEDQVSLLWELREYTDGLYVLRDAEKLDSRTISVLYIVKMLLNDFWRNLGGDATFGAQEVMNDAAAFSRHLRRFIYFALVASGKDEETSNALFQAIASYYACLSHMRKKGEQVYHL
jgi:hypothetical protein